MKLEWKNKRLLKSFISIALVLFVIMAAVLSAVYDMSLEALEREVQGLSLNTAYDFLNRFEDTLSQCDRLAANLVSDTTVQRFFSVESPEALDSDFFQKLKGKVQPYGLSCVDSVILYAPDFDSVYIGSQFERAYTVSELRESDEVVDLSWLELLEDGERITTDFYIRAKADVWPYYISIIKHFRSRSMDGVAVVNIDLRSLYNQLMAPQNTELELYGIDGNGQVFLREKKQELFLDISSVAELSHFRPGEELSQIHREEGIAYAQAVSEKYGYTVVAVSRLDSYLRSLTRIHQRFLLWGIGALTLVILLALLYSVRLVRPIRTIQQVLEHPTDWQNNKNRHSREVRDIADEIVRALQFNSQLQNELSQRLDLLNRTQMLALQAQINPHFLFNTLNMICLMIERDCGDEYLGGQMIRSLSDILRYALTDRKLSTIREELEYAGKYLSILRQRYKNFEYTLEADPELEGCLIPKLVLQPLLENAIQHGFSDRMPEEKGVLSLKIHRELFAYGTGKPLPSVAIALTDNGIGIPPQRLEQIRKSIRDHNDISTAHIGLPNVAQRFYLCFQSEQSFRLESREGEGTRIDIRFPIRSESSASSDS